MVGDEEAVHLFLKNRFKASDTEGSEDRSTKVATAFADLNGDGRPDALAYVSGPRWCGSGGCKLYILENLGRAYRIAGRTTITRPPVQVLQSRSHGWRDVAVWVGGGGIASGHDAVLRFDGRKYPGNPSTQPALKGLRNRAGEIVIATDAASAPL